MSEHVLITGAAGQIGQVLIAGLARRYSLRLTDIRPIPDQIQPPFVIADITDFAAMCRVCDGVTTVIHLAGNPHPSATLNDLMAPNVIGMATILGAAHEAGCRRVVFASSGHTMLGYPPEQRLDATLRPRPKNHYGATKVWGETMARYYAEEKGLSCLCLRIGWVVANDSDALRPDAPALGRALTHGDLVRLFSAAIEAPADLRFGLFYGASDNKRPQFDLSETRRQLGYTPVDDAFVLARRLRWRRARRRLRARLALSAAARRRARRLSRLARRRPG